MRKRTIAILTGALLLAGGVAAIAAVGERGGWQGHGRGMMGRGGWNQGQGMGGRDRVLAKDEADARARERFARLDKNSDGFIDAAEIEAALAGRRGMSGQMGQRLIHRFDENRDGKVTRDEFTNDLKKRFAQADLNNDGKISDDDLPPMMRGRNVLAGDRGPGMMGRRGGQGGDMGLAWLKGADANKDGVITLDEALAEGQKRFAPLDRNKDGTIDQADFDAMRKEMVEYRVKRFIHRYSADKDGRISRDQFFKEASERFALADLNNDGRITRDEMGMGWGGRRSRGGPGGPDGDGPRRGPGMMAPGQGPGPGMAPGMGPGAPGRN